MRFLLVLLLAGCAAPVANPVTGLPDLGRVLPAVRRGPSLTADLEVAAKAIEDRESPGSLDRAVAVLRLHWSEDRENPAVNLALSEAHSRACESLDLKKPGDRQEHQAQRQAGLFHADAAFRIKPDEGAIQYWRATLLLHHADAEQSYQRLQEAHGLLHKAASASPRIDSGGPARLLGRVYQETPGFPFLGSKPRAVEWYGKSLQVAPDFIQTHLWLGETLLHLKQTEKARYHLEKAAVLPLRKGHEREDGIHRASAQALLGTLPN